MIVIRGLTKRSERNRKTEESPTPMHSPIPASTTRAFLDLKRAFEPRFAEVAHKSSMECFRSFLQASRRIVSNCSQTTSPHSSLESFSGLRSFGYSFSCTSSISCGEPEKARDTDQSP